LKPGEQDFDLNKPETGDWSWGKAREYYFNALTKSIKEERDESFADCFRSLGQLMYL